MSTQYKIGQVVYSKCGRDQGKPFIIVALEEEYAYIVDGKLRRLEKPKLKKYKHIQQTNVVLEWIKQKILEEDRVSNSDIRKALQEYLEQSLRQ